MEIDSFLCVHVDCICVPEIYGEIVYTTSQYFYVFATHASYTDSKLFRFMTFGTAFFKIPVGNRMNYGPRNEAKSIKYLYKSKPYKSNFYVRYTWLRQLNTYKSITNQFLHKVLIFRYLTSRIKTLPFIP